MNLQHRAVEVDIFQEEVVQSLPEGPDHQKEDAQDLPVIDLEPTRLKLTDIHHALKEDLGAEAEVLTQEKGNPQWTC